MGKSLLLRVIVASPADVLRDSSRVRTLRKSAGEASETGVDCIESTTRGSCYNWRQNRIPKENKTIHTSTPSSQFKVGVFVFFSTGGGKSGTALYGGDGRKLYFPFF